MATMQTRKNNIITFALVAALSISQQQLHAKLNGPQLTEAVLGALRGVSCKIEYDLKKDDSKSAHFKRFLISMMRMTHDVLALENHHRDFQSHYLVGLLAFDAAQMVAHGARIFKSSAQSNVITTNANTMDDDFFLGEPEQEEVLEQIATPTDNEPVTPERLEFVRKYALPALESLAAVLVACTGHGDAVSQKALFIGQALLTLSRTCQMHLNQDDGDLKNMLGGLAIVNAVYSTYQVLFPDSDLNGWIEENRRLEAERIREEAAEERRREQERLEQEQRWRVQQQRWEDENRERLRQLEEQRRQQEAERERQRQERIRQQREQRQQQEAERERQRQERDERRRQQQQPRPFWQQPAQPEPVENIFARLQREQREREEQERLRRQADGFEEGLARFAREHREQEDFIARFEREQAERERQRQEQRRQEQAERERQRLEQLREQAARNQRRQEALRQAAEQQRIQEQQAQEAQRRENIRLNADLVDVFPAVRRDLERGIPLDEIVQEQPFAILGLAENANLAEVNRRYNRLALANHPDRNPDGHRAMQILNGARDAARERLER